MIPFNIALVIFACVASISAEELSLAGLKKAVLDNYAASRKLTDVYREQEYYTMESILYFHSLKYTNPIRVKQFPTVIPLFSSFRPDEQRVYNAMRLNMFMHPYLTNASFLSDNLKINALHVAIVLGGLNITEKPTLPEMTDKVLQIIHQEKGVLVNGRLVKPDQKLEKLYSEIKEVAGTWLTGDYWLDEMRETFFLRERCTMQGLPCSGGKIREAIDNYLAVWEQLRSVTPIDSKHKIDSFLNIRLKAVKAFGPLNKIYENNKSELWCLMTVDGCMK